MTLTKRVLEHLQLAGVAMTAREISDAFEIELNAAKKALQPLLYKDRIHVAGERKDGCQQLYLYAFGKKAAFSERTCEAFQILRAMQSIAFAHGRGFTPEGKFRTFEGAQR